MKKTENPFYIKVNEIIKKEKFDKLKSNGFEVDEFNIRKDYINKGCRLEFDLLYQVEKWGLYRSYSAFYDEDHLKNISIDIKSLKSEIKKTKAFHKKLTRQECRTGKFLKSGWHIYYVS